MDAQQPLHARVGDLLRIVLAHGTGHSGTAHNALLEALDLCVHAERQDDATAVTSMEAIAGTLAEVSQNLEYIAYGIAKLVERCFCGHLLEAHPENGACVDPDCPQKCDGFKPIHLAIAQIHNTVAVDLKALIARITPLLPDVESGIVAPPAFGPFKTH